MLKEILPINNKKKVKIYFEGSEYEVTEGISVSAAVQSLSDDYTRTNHKGHKRAPFCQIGVCFECLMEINGVPNQQSCLIKVEEGMQIKRQLGAPDFAPHKE